MYRYVALLDGPSQRGGNELFDERLRQLGLRHSLNMGHIELYAAETTPVIPLASGGALIGHVFSREESVSSESIDLSSLPSRPKLIEFLVSHAWGEYLLFHAPGGDAESMTVMRDPSGGIDCFYSFHQRFVTSDISIAAQLGLYSREVDWDFIHANLIYPHHKAGRTGLVSLRELLPGCQVQIGGDRHPTKQVWSPWCFVSPPCRQHDRHQAQSDVRRAVSSTVKRWAETDKSLLLELSGGLDSSIVAACLQGTNAHVAYCNLVTPVPGADERRYASLMADMLGVELHVERLGFARTPLDFQPPPNTVAPSTWFLQHAANELSEAIGTQLGVNSFFSGGGGDTVFCYSRTAAPAADAFRERGTIAGIRAIRDLAELHQCTFWKAGRLALRKLLAPPKPPRRPDTSFLSATSANRTLEPHPWFAVPDGALAGDRERIFDLTGTQVFRDGLARGAKRHVRMPLLSQPVLEACLRVPSWM